mgnify:CR=1 FL=1
MRNFILGTDWWTDCDDAVAIKLLANAVLARKVGLLGIGINVSQRPEDFTPEVREIATSLAQALGRPVSRPALAAEVIRELDRLYAALTAGEIAPYLAEYRRRCVNLGRTVRLLGPDGGETAEALDIDGDFGLVVRTADGGIRTVRSGEVSVRGLYGYTE